MDPAPARTIASLIPGKLNSRQAELLDQFERACQALGEVIRFGDMSITFQDGCPMNYKFTVGYRPKCGT